MPDKLIPGKKKTPVYKKSSFKMRSGNSPLKETEDWFNVRGYLKGEQGLIPDWKGESTSKTATKASQSIQKGHDKVKKVVKNMLSPKMTKVKKNSNENFSAKKSKLKKSKEGNMVSMPSITNLKELNVNTQTKPKKGRYNTL